MGRAVGRPGEAALSLEGRGGKGEKEPCGRMVAFVSFGGAVVVSEGPWRRGCCEVRVDRWRDGGLWTRARRRRPDVYRLRMGEEEDGADPAEGRGGGDPVVGAAAAEARVDGRTGTFRSEFGSVLPEWLVNRAEELGFVRPTEVQRQALHALLGGGTRGDGSAEGGDKDRKAGEVRESDVIIHARTGSGKTLAYLLPTFASIDPARASLQAVIVVPTQELGIQVYRVARRLAAGWKLPDSEKKLVVLPMLAQAGMRRQKLMMRQAAPRVVVGMVDRLAELERASRLQLNNVSVLVVDEFDACLADNDTTSLLRSALQQRSTDGKNQTRLTILASATVPQHRHFVRTCIKEGWTRPDVKHVWVDADQRVPDTLSHTYVVCDLARKITALKQILQAQTPVSALAFVNDSRSAEAVASRLRKAMGYTEDEGSTIAAIEWNSALPDRKRAMNAFRSGEAKILIASDVAARGLDVPQVTHVFNIDLPADADTYLHRAGRTGRQGRPGVVCSLSGPNELFVLRRISNSLAIDLHRITNKHLTPQNDVETVHCE